MLITLDKHLVVNKEMIESPNLCDRFSKEDLTRIGDACYLGYTRDLASRSAWEKRMQAAMDLAMQYSPGKTWPWPNCSNVVFPLVTLGALQFSSRAYSNIVQGTDVVHYRVVGEDPTGALLAQAYRIGAHMSWQVLEEDKGWEEQYDRLLINLSIVGCAFIKDFFSGRTACPVSELVLAKDLVVDYFAKSIEDAARKTQHVQLYRNKIYEHVKDGLFRDVLSESWYNGTPALPSPPNTADSRIGINPPQPDEDTPFQFLEQHRYLDLDGDGYAEPYIVTLEKVSRCTARIVARFESEEDVQRMLNKDIVRIKATEYYTKYSFIPAPDGSIYDIGYGIFLGPINEAVNSGINQLLDSGTMQNSMGGFLGRGAKIRGGVYTMAPWEWRRVDSTGDDLRKSLVPFPERQPSTVMFQLINLLIEYANRVAGTVDQAVGVSPGQNTPAETSRNTAEAGMQVYSTIFKRIWRSTKESFKKRHMLNARYLPTEKKFGTGGQFVKQEDYKSNPDNVIPSADPNITSQSQRVARADILRQAAASVPGYNREQVERKFLRAMQVDDIELVYPGPDKVLPLPNPKMQIEEMKLKGKQMDLDFKKQELILNLHENRKLTMAQIRKLEAESIKLLAEVQNDRAAAQIAAFETAINTLKAHNDMINERIETLSKVTQGDGDEKGSNSGERGVPGVANSSGDSGADGASGSVA